MNQILVFAKIDFDWNLFLVMLLLPSKNDYDASI